MDTYEFEQNQPSYGTDAQIEADLAVFVSRLGRGDAKSNPETDQQDEAIIGGEDRDELRRSLRKFVIANHRAAWWYDVEREKRRSTRDRYAWGRIGLLLFLPIALYGISIALEKADLNVNEGISQATVLLTGMLAAYRASNQWIEAKFAASNFGKAASQLKEKIYAFEQAHAGTNLGDSTEVKALTQALEAGVIEARAIVRKQRDDYFVASAPPPVDVVDVLTTAKADVAGLLKTFQSPSLDARIKETEAAAAAALARETLAAGIAKLAARMSAREELIGKKEGEKQGADDARERALTALIKELRQAQDADEKALMERSADLGALGSGE